MTMAQISLTRTTQPTVRKVIIVGAGIAGLAAAQKLSNTRTEKVNFEVKVLEAKSVPGGRLRSIKFEEGRHSVELGASYLYYFNNCTTLTDFVERKKLTKAKIEGAFDEIFIEKEIPNIHLLSNGEEIKHSSAKYYQRIFDDVHTELGECSDQNDWSYVINKDWPKKNIKSKHPNSITADEYLDIRFKEAVQTSQGDLALPKDCSPNVIFERMMTYERFMNGTNDLADLNIHAYGDFHNPDGQYILRECYRDIVDKIMGEIPKDTVLFDSQVKTTEWQPITETTQSSLDEDPPVRVSCENGAIYKAHHVIVTVSLGVLKWNCLRHGDNSSPKQKLFSPDLPKEKLNAIAKLGMGEGASIKVQFPTPIMDREHSTIELFWLEGDKKLPKAYTWAHNVDVVDRVGSCTYGLWFTGKDARDVEAANDEEVGKGVRLVLEKFLAKQVPRPIRVEKSSWISDPCFRGSLSYCAKGSTKRDRNVLSEPIHTSQAPLQILFAGEATHPSLFSTSNGAYETGLQEAERLLNHYHS